MPLIWRIPDGYPQGQIGRYDRSSGPDRFIFSEARRLPEPLEMGPSARFECKKDALCQNDCIWADVGLPIVNERMKNFLNERVPDKIQFFGIDISAEDGIVLGYYLLNSTKEVEVIDLESSKYRFVPGTKSIMSFSDLRLNDGAMEGSDIGRDKIYLPYLFVGNRLAKELDTVGFRGVSLIEPSSVV